MLLWSRKKEAVKGSKSQITGKLQVKLGVVVGKIDTIPHVV